jgi:hypothetical protein
MHGLEQVPLKWPREELDRGLSITISRCEEGMWHGVLVLLVSVPRSRFSLGHWHTPSEAVTNARWMADQFIAAAKAQAP